MATRRPIVSVDGRRRQLPDGDSISGAPVSSVAGRTGDVVLAPADVGLGNVDNTSDANKPISTATQVALNDKAADGDVVKLTGAQTIAGAKTFSSAVVVPAGATGPQVPRAQEIPNHVRAMLIGTVSQSGGVPTGDIFQYGSNALGFYIRFANGVQVCWRDISLGTAINAAGGLFITNNASGSWPAAFSSTPKATASAKNSVNAIMWTANLTATASGFVTLVGVSVINTASCQADLIAIGRWFG